MTHKSDCPTVPPQNRVSRTGAVFPLAQVGERGRSRGKSGAQEDDSISEDLEEDLAAGVLVLAVRHRVDKRLFMLRSPLMKARTGSFLVFARRNRSYRIDDLQIAEIGFIHPKIPRKDAIGLDKGMGADEKIGQDMDSLRQDRLALWAGRFKSMATFAA